MTNSEVVVKVDTVDVETDRLVIAGECGILLRFSGSYAVVALACEPPRTVVLPRELVADADEMAAARIRAALAKRR